MKSINKSEEYLSGIRFKSLLEIEKLSQIQDHRAELQNLRNIFKKDKQTIGIKQSERPENFKYKIWKPNQNFKGQIYNAREQINRLKQKEQNSSIIRISKYQSNCITPTKFIKQKLSPKQDYIKKNSNSNDNKVIFKVSQSLKLSQLKSPNSQGMNKDNTIKKNDHQKLLTQKKINDFLMEINTKQKRSLNETQSLYYHIAKKMNFKEHDRTKNWMENNSISSKLDNLQIKYPKTKQIKGPLKYRKNIPDSDCVRKTKTEIRYQLEEISPWKTKNVSLQD